MAHGAPDHTRLSDDAFAHYEYIRPASGAWGMIAGEKRNLVDLDLTGVFGLAFMLVDNKSAILKIEVDGYDVYQSNPSSVFGSLGFMGSAIGSMAGVSKYDEINDDYGLWFDAGWKVYIHNHLLIQVFNISVNPCNVHIIRGRYLKYKG